MCNNPNWPAPANTAKAMAITVLVFSIIDLVTFVIQGWAAGIASIIAIVASSMIICCARQSTGPGSGGIFKATGVAAIIASIVHLVGAILLIVFWASLHNLSTGSIDSSCVNSYCSNSAWQYRSCGSSLCTSEYQCRNADCSGCVSASCTQGAKIVASWIAAVCWPGIVLSILCFIFELVLAIFAFKAAGPMEQSKGTMVFGGAVGHPTVYGQAHPTTYGVAQPTAYVTSPRTPQPQPTAYATPMAVVVQ